MMASIFSLCSNVESLGGMNGPVELLVQLQGGSLTAMFRIAFRQSGGVLYRSPVTILSLAQHMG